MPVYDGGVTAYRDTTKWLTAFVPLASLAAAATTVGPDLVRSVQQSTGIGDWYGRHGAAAWCLLAILLGIVSVLISGGRVLSISPVDLGRLQSEEFAGRRAKAIGEGVLAPEFFTDESFVSAMANLANAWDQPALTEADKLNLTRLQGAVGNLRQWAIFDRVRTAFRRFVGVFAVATAAIVAGVVIAPSQLGSGPVIDKPTAVTVALDHQGRADLAAATQCTDPARTTFVAVDGTWRQPTLLVDGPGCRFAARWTPRAEHVAVRPTP